MKSLIFFLSIFIHASLFCQDSTLTVTNDHMYVFSFSGVNVRKAATLKSSVVKKLQHGEKVRVTANSLFKDYIDNRTAHWYKVKTGNTVGFVFGGFLSINEPPHLDHGEFTCEDNSYYIDWMKNLSSSTSIASEDYEILINDSAPELCQEIHTSIYNSGEIMIAQNSTDQSYLSFTSNHLSYNDVLNFLDYVAACREKHCSATSNYEKSYVIPLKGPDGSIQSIRCNEPYQIKAEKVMGQLVIELNMNTM